jgi:hypothetical protein
MSNRVEKLRQTQNSKTPLAEETIDRACGCPMQFQPKGDQYDEQRRQKIRGKRCAECKPAEPKVEKAPEPTSEPVQAKPKGKKWSKLTPQQRDELTKGKRRYPVGTVVHCTMSSEQEWEVTLCPPDGQFRIDLRGPGIHGLLSKLDDEYQQWLAEKSSGEKANQADQVVQGLPEASEAVPAKEQD